MKLNSDKVPLNLRSLTSLAEQFGFEGIDQRVDALSILTPELLRELVRFVKEVEPALDAWLEKPDLESDEFSEEQFAFSFLRTVAEEAGESLGLSWYS